MTLLFFPRSLISHCLQRFPIQDGISLDNSVVTEMQDLDINLKHFRKTQDTQSFLQIKLKQENAMRYNNRDDLLQLNFTLKISIFS